MLREKPRDTSAIRGADNRFSLFAGDGEGLARPEVVRGVIVLRHDLIKNRTRRCVLNREAEDVLYGRGTDV